MGKEIDFGNQKQYEDIVSDSSFLRKDDEIPFSEIGKKHTKRKTHKRDNFWNRMSRGKKITAVVLAVVLFLVALFAINPFHMIEHIIYNYNNMTENEDELGFSGKIDKKIVNIALFGIDTRNKKTFKGNSDSIMILSLNTELKTVKIVSIMRDTIVPITENGKTRYAKINSAYAKSPELAIKTLNENFGLDISEYATVNFYGMSEIIDAVGGIEATVTEDELKWKGYDHPNLNNCMDEICKNLGLDAKKYYISTPGEHHMNGVQAVAYSRVRNCKSIWGTNNDYGRTDRQRHVMEQLFNKAIKLEKGKYASLAKALIPCTETSLEYNEIMSLAFNILLEHPTFYQSRFPQDGWQMPFRWSGYGSVVYYDIGFASKVLHSLIYEGVTVEDYIAQNGIQKNDWFANVGKKTGSTSSTAVTSSQAASSNDTISKTASEEPPVSEPPESSDETKEPDESTPANPTDDTSSSSVTTDTSGESGGSGNE